MFAACVGRLQYLFGLVGLVCFYPLFKCQGVSTNDFLNASFVSNHTPLSISPRLVNIQITMQQQFVASGGSGSYRFEVSNGSGSVGSNTGLFVAPGTTGAAVLSVIDSRGNRDFAIATIVPLTTITCPTNFILVPANSAVGMSADFCVAKYEMKCAADALGTACSGAALSQSANRPWTNINQIVAKTTCSSLGAGYHLMTNPESMAISRNIEVTAANWSSGTVGTGSINAGHTDLTPNNSLAASTDNNPCSGTGQTCSDLTWHSQRRTHVLSNGNVIWDFAGNVEDWIDWLLTQSQKAYLSTDLGPVGAWREWTQINSNITLGSVMEPKSWQATNATYNSAQAIGQYFGSLIDPAAAVRGGDWGSGAEAGIYALQFSAGPSTGNNFIGFRCTFQ